VIPIAIDHKDPKRYRHLEEEHASNLFCTPID